MNMQKELRTVHAQAMEHLRDKASEFQDQIDSVNSLIAQARDEYEEIYEALERAYEAALTAQDAYVAYFDPQATGDRGLDEWRTICGSLPQPSDLEDIDPDDMGANPAYVHDAEQAVVTWAEEQTPRPERVAQEVNEAIKLGDLFAATDLAGTHLHIRLDHVQTLAGLITSLRDQVRLLTNEKCRPTEHSETFGLLDS